MIAELTLRFSHDSQVNVAFGGTDSGQLAFTNPLHEQDREDIRWYVETYGARSLADPDDREAKRIEARLPELGQALFNAVFSSLPAVQRFLAFRDAPADARVLTIDAQDASILSLPWELLHDTTGKGNFLFREKPHISVRRRITGATGGRDPTESSRNSVCTCCSLSAAPKTPGSSIRGPMRKRSSTRWNPRRRAA